MLPGWRDTGTNLLSALPSSAFSSVLFPALDRPIAATSVQRGVRAVGDRKSPSSPKYCAPL